MAVTTKQIYAPKPTEVSVTQVETSGTKVATITVNGTTTDIYAPEGGTTAAGVSAVDYTSQYTSENGVLIGTLTITTAD